jgi:hypothetical protein
MEKAKKTGKLTGWEFVDLPDDEKHPNYFKLLVRNCIAAYAMTYNDKTALDYNQVIGKMRALVLDNDEYKKQTRSIRAKQIIDEAKELNELRALAQGLELQDLLDEDDPESYDPRPSAKGVKGGKSSDNKDEITLRFKIAQERRAFLGLDSRSEEIEESEALNLFFVPLTREELAALDTVEVGEGSGDGRDALTETPDGGSDVEKRLKELEADALRGREEVVYVTNPDGTIEEA